LARKGGLSFLPERIGSWWDHRRRTSNEIDVLAISDSERALLAGECKWSVNPVGIDVLEDLKLKTEAFQENEPWENITYYLFSKSGFTPAIQEQADREGVGLISAEDCLS
jgi:ABC-type oligopeptide transport system substrate-binding subunit